MARKTKQDIEASSTASTAIETDKQTKTNNVEADMSNNQSNTTQDANFENAAYSRSRCGGALRKAREAQHLTVKEVASQLKISSRQIEAIEADDFSVLPESTIVRGFIRNYAKLLKLDASPLLDAYNVLVPSQQPLAFTVKPTSSMKVGGYVKPQTGRYFLLSLMVLIALGAWIFYQSYIQKPSPTTPASAEIEAEESAQLPEVALPMAERIAPDALPLEGVGNAPASTAPEADATALTSTNINLPADANAPASNTVLPERAQNATAVAAVVPLVVPPAALPLPTVIAGASNQSTKLEFNATQETWISVVDASGKEIYNKIIFAGSRDTVNVKPPIQVVVGNASGAALMVNNKQINLAPHTRSNVARIKLDQTELNKLE